MVQNQLVMDSASGQLSVQQSSSHIPSKTSLVSDAELIRRMPGVFEWQAATAAWEAAMVGAGLLVGIELDEYRAKYKARITRVARAYVG